MILTPVRAFQAQMIQPPRVLWDEAEWKNHDLTVPLDVEIGCGVGFHPIAYAKQNPGRYLIAIEKTAAKFERFRSRLEHHLRFKNLLPIHADAVAWITHFLGEEQVSRYFILYPNPNPKNPSARWIRMPFFNRLLWTLKPGGTIEFATNEAFYADELLKYAPTQWGLTIQEQVEFRAYTHPKLSPRTHFEKKYLARGESCRRIVLQKPERI